MNPIDFKQLFHSSPGFYLILDTSLTILEASNSYLQATMTKRENLLGQNVFDAFPDNPADPFATGVKNLNISLQKVIGQKTVDRMPIQKYDIRRPIEMGGEFEVRYWRPVNSPVLDQDNNVIYIIHEVEDVTELVLLRVENDESEFHNEELENFRIFFESAPGLFLVVSPTKNCEILAVSNEYLKAANDTRKNLLGRSLFDVYPLDLILPRDITIAKLKESIDRAIIGRVPDFVGVSKLDIRFENAAHRVSHENYWSSINSPIFSKDGKVQFIVHHLQDVTESVLTKEKEVKENEERLRSIFENSIDAVLLARPRGEIIMANKATEEMLGYTEDELRKFGWEALVVPGDKTVNEAIKKRSETGYFRGELLFKHKNGNIVPVELSSSIFRDAQGNKWTSMFIQNITERKISEAEKEDLLRRIDEKRRWIEALIEHAPVGMILIKDPHGESIVPNPCAKKMFDDSVDWSKGLRGLTGLIRGNFSSVLD